MKSDPYRKRDCRKSFEEKFKLLSAGIAHEIKVVMPLAVLCWENHKAHKGNKSTWDALSLLPEVVCLLF